MIRTTIHEIIGMTPYFVTLGKEICLNKSRFGPSSDNDTLDDDVELIDRTSLVQKPVALENICQDKFIMIYGGK